MIVQNLALSQILNRPGILYGLPKIHKTLVPLCPIFSACGTPAFYLAKFLVPVLSPLAKNEFTMPNSYCFAAELRQMNIEDDSRVFMVSFDVENLFTNIPLQETINICISSLFSNT